MDSDSHFYHGVPPSCDNREQVVLVLGNPEITVALVTGKLQLAQVLTLPSYCTCAGTWPSPPANVLTILAAPSSRYKNS